MIEGNGSIGGINLKTLREMLGGISQEELARRLETSIKTVVRGESGQNIRLSIPQMKNLDRELKSIGLSIQDLSDNLG